MTNKNNQSPVEGWEEELVLYLWGKPVSADCKELSEMLVPFIKEQLQSQKQHYERIIKEIIKLSDHIESQHPNTEFNEWRAFKQFRNTLRENYLGKTT